MNKNLIQKQAQDFIDKLWSKSDINFVYKDLDINNHSTEVSKTSLSITHVWSFGIDWITQQKFNWLVTNFNVILDDNKITLICQHYIPENYMERNKIKTVLDKKEYTFNSIEEATQNIAEIVNDMQTTIGKLVFSGKLDINSTSRTFLQKIRNIVNI